MTDEETALMGAYRAALDRVFAFGPMMTTARIREIADGRGQPILQREGREMALMLLEHKAHDELIARQLEDIMGRRTNGRS